MFTLNPGARAAAIVAFAGLVATASPAQAVQFGPTTPEGYVAGLSGATLFGAPDVFSTIACPLCDGVVNFATYSNADKSDWRIDLNVNPTFLQGFDVDARWVFLYQIQNTDPVSPEGELENFNVTHTDKVGDPIERNPYTSGGFIAGSILNTFNDGSSLSLDVPNDWVPGIVENKTVGAGPDDIDPTQLLFTNASGPNPISSPSIKNASAAYSGGLFEFGNPLIATGAFSEVLFLTSDDPWASYVWAETQSAGGSGAAGDVPGIKASEPATLGMLGLGLAGLVVARRKLA